MVDNEQSNPLIVEYNATSGPARTMAREARLRAVYKHPLSIYGQLDLARPEDDAAKAYAVVDRARGPVYDLLRLIECSFADDIVPV